MPSPKNPGNELYSTILRQDRPFNTPESSSTAETATGEQTANKAAPLKLPQLRADERAESAVLPPANENNTLMFLQSWQRGKEALTRGSQNHLPTIIMFCGATLSAMWLAAAVVYVHNVVGWQNITTLMPHEIGGFLAGLLAPVALFWMVLTFWLRSVDVKLYAEALREEIQRMIFPSDEAERRVNNDIDRLVKQTAEMSRATRMALGTLQQARQAVQSETQALQDGVVTTATQLEQLEDRLGKRQHALSELHRDIAQQHQTFEQANVKLLKDAHALDDIITHAASKTTEISDVLQAPIKQLQNWQNDVIDTLNGGVQTLADKQDLLRADANDIAEKTLLLADTLQRSTDKLYDFTDDALDKAKLIETRLQGQGLSLRNTLQEVITQTESLTTQRDALLDVLQHGTERGKAELIAHIALLNDAITQMDQTQQALTTQMQHTHDHVSAQMQQTQQSVAALMDDVLQNAADNWTLQADRFSTTIHDNALKTTAELALGQQSLRDGLTVTQETVDQLVDHLQRAIDQASVQMNLRATQFGETIQSDAKRNLESLSNAQDNLQQRYTLFQFDVEAATQRAGELLKDIGQKLNHVSDAVSEDMTGHYAEAANFVATMLAKYQDEAKQSAADLTTLQRDLSAVARELADRTQHLGHTGEETALIVQQLYSALEKGLEQVTQTTTRLQDGLEAAQTAFDKPIERLDHAAHYAQDKAQVIGNILDQRINNLQELGGALVSQAAMLGSDLTNKSQILEGVLGRLQHDVRTLSNDMVTQTEKLDDQVRVTFAQVNSLLPHIQDVQQNFAQTSVQAEKAQLIMTQLNDSVVSGSKTMMMMSDDAANRVAQSLSLYQDMQNSYQTLNQVATAQHDDLHARHRNDLDMLQNGTTLMRDHADQVNHIYTTLQGTLQSFEQQAGQSQSAARQVTQTLEQTQHALVSSGEQLQRQADGTTQQLRIIQQILDGSAQATINHVNTLNAAMQTAERQSAALNVKAEGLLQLTTKHTSAVDNAVQRLHDAVQETGRSYHNLSDIDTKLAGLSKVMQTHRADMVEQHKLVDQAIAEILTRLQLQTDKLAATSLEVGERSEMIRQQDQMLQREYFFNATKFIVESLHSLALDFTRMLDGELPEKTWRAYKMGDTSVFTKRLVSLRDTLSHDKIRQKFADDVEFRTYVQRYLRQFDEIHDHAKQQDYGDLLSGVFISSDIGRLYQMLSTILEHR